MSEDFVPGDFALTQRREVRIALIFTMRDSEEYISLGRLEALVALTKDRIEGLVNDKSQM
jgi:hypothetical protein